MCQNRQIVIAVMCSSTTAGVMGLKFFIGKFGENELQQSDVAHADQSVTNLHFIVQGLKPKVYTQATCFIYYF